MIAQVGQGIGYLDLDLAAIERALKVTGRAHAQGSFLYDRHPVTKSLSLAQVVGAEQNSAARSLQFADSVTDQLRTFGVERGGRLVKYQDGRLVQERPRKTQLLHHATREGARVIVTAIP
jgi:hypothetical protein